MSDRRIRQAFRGAPIVAPPADDAVDAVVAAVRDGLLAEAKSLPAWLLYDDAGCALYEQITRLPEYYLTRAEADLLRRHADVIIATAATGGARLALAELGAGTATKTEILLGALVRAQGSAAFLACDIAEATVQAAAARIAARLPAIEARAVSGTHEDAGPAIAALVDRQVVLFLGSSIGNYADDDAAALLAGVRRFLRPDARLVLGTDLRKDPRRLVAAYDDAAGVTAAFSKNLLHRLNREVGATFDVDRFRHVAVWDEGASNIEIYLEATSAASVWIGALGREVRFARGERIHTETSAKYDLARVDRILGAAGFARVATHVDGEGLFAVHTAVAVSGRRP